MHRFTGEISPRRARGVPVAEAGEGARGEVASRRARIAFMSEVKAGPAPAPPPFGKRRDAKGTGREWAGVGDDRGAAVNTRLLVMRREKPSPPLARDTCNFAPREGRGLVPPLPESSRGTPPPTPPGAGGGRGPPCRPRGIIKELRRHAGTRGVFRPRCPRFMSHRRRNTRPPSPSLPSPSPQPVSERRYREARYSARKVGKNRARRKPRIAFVPRSFLSVSIPYSSACRCRCRKSSPAIPAAPSPMNILAPRGTATLLSGDIKPRGRARMAAEFHSRRTNLSHARAGRDFTRTSRHIRTVAVAAA
jgi:hypothetical protein